MAGPVSINLLVRLVRIPGFHALWRKLQVGSIATRVQFDILPRPAYAFGVYSAAVAASRLGLPELSAIEFGVAGGRGLVTLERLAAEIGPALGVRIAVYGFDSGKGMPPPLDYRDLPHVWGEGFYQMDVDALRRKLTTAQLVLGDVAETVPALVAAGTMPPVGFVAFDLDYYSATKAAFRLFEAASATRLPRVYCYFDDIAGPEIACMNEYVGELLAIKEWNAEHERVKISPILHLATERIRPARWNVKMYALHDFAHPLYTRNVTPAGDTFRQRPLEG